MAEHNITHGHMVHGIASPTYNCWRAMKVRCLKNTHRAFKNYGGRGISVCERWLKFCNFLADMGERPAGTTLDRINNDGNYELGNCRWATKEVQANNKRETRSISFNGETRTIAEWAKKLGISYYRIHARISKGYPLEAAFFKGRIPTKNWRRSNRSRLINFRGETKCAADWARDMGIKPQLLNYHLKTKAIEDVFAFISSR